MTPEEFADSTDYAQLLAAENEAEARRLEPWAWAIALPLVVLIVAGIWHAVSWVAR